MRPFLKNERGLTLIELLAVILILSILFLIAVPMVSTIIENSRKDAYLADAEVIVYAAKLAELNNEKGQPIGGGGGFAGGTYYSVKKLKELGYLGNVKHEYHLDDTVVVCYKGTYSVRLFLASSRRQILPVAGEIRETPITADQESIYRENGTTSFNGVAGRNSVAKIEDIRGKRNLVRLP